MSQEPKKRHSRARQGKRRAAISLKISDPAHRMTNFHAMMQKEMQEKKFKKEKPAKEAE